MQCLAQATDARRVVAADQAKAHDRSRMGAARISATLNTRSRDGDDAQAGPGVGMVKMYIAGVKAFIDTGVVRVKPGGGQMKAVAWSPSAPIVETQGFGRGIS